MNARYERFFKDHKVRIKNLEKQFQGYHTDVSEREIRRYLLQFKKTTYMLIALKLLENIDYFSNSRVTKLLQSLTGLLNSEIDLRDKNVYICSMSSSAGKSTDTFVKKFRDVVKLDEKKFGNKFLHLDDLKPWIKDTKRKTIVFIDDFIGSGGTVNNLWELNHNWFNPKHKYILGVIAGYKTVIQDIEESLPLRIKCVEEFEESIRIFHEDNTNFTKDEKNILKQFCRHVDSRKDFRYGYKNSQSLVMFYENAPNNCLPILYSRRNDWYPLFPRLGE